MLGLLYFGFFSKSSLRSTEVFNAFIEVALRSPSQNKPPKNLQQNNFLKIKVFNLEIQSKIQILFRH